MDPVRQANPEPFFAVGLCYEDFAQTTDDFSLTTGLSTRKCNSAAKTATGTPVLAGVPVKTGGPSRTRT